MLKEVVNFLKDDTLLFSISAQFMSPISFVVNVVINDLVGRDVKHIVLNGKVGASVVNWDYLLMVDKNYL